MSESLWSQIDVLLLVGGQGKRLRPVIDDRPKPMADMGGRPFLDLLIDYASTFGARRFILCTGYKAESVVAHYQGGSQLWQILVSHEEQPLGTAGAIRNAENHLQSDPFLVMNGDSFCPVDLQAFLESHLSTQALVSLALVSAEDTGDFGTVGLDACGKVVRFEEKQGKAEQAFISAGIYLFERQVVSMIPAGAKCSLEYDLFPRLVGGRFHGFVTNAKLTDIGTPERYRTALRVLPRNPSISRRLADTEPII